MKDCEKRAKAKYRQKCKQVNIIFCPTEADLYEHIKAQGNMSGYLKQLVKKDMCKQ